MTVHIHVGAEAILHNRLESDHMVVVYLCKNCINVHIGAFCGNVHLHDIFDDAFFKKIIFQHFERVVVGTLRVADEQVIFVKHHHISAFDADGFAAFIGRKFIHAVEVDGLAIGFEAPEYGVAGENQPGKEIFTETGFFSRFGDDNVFFYSHGQITGKNKIGDGVEENTIFRFQVSGDQRISQLLWRKAGEPWNKRVRKFLKINDFIDDFVATFFYAATLG